MEHVARFVVGVAFALLVGFLMSSFIVMVMATSKGACGQTVGPTQPDRVATAYTILVTVKASGAFTDYWYFRSSTLELCQSRREEVRDRFELVELPECQMEYVTLEEMARVLAAEKDVAEPDATGRGSRT